MPARGKKYYQIVSIEKGIQVLELLADKKALSVSAVAAELGFNRATSHRFLATLRDLGYIEKSEGHRYQLTFKLLELGIKKHNQFEARMVACRFMQELSLAFKETINLGLWNGSGVLNLDKIDSPEILRMDTPLGSHAPAYCTALGKAILANISMDELKEYFKKTKLVAHGPKTITNKKDLKKELEVTCQRGYAIDDEELAPGLRCVAAPVFDHTQRARYALSVSGPSMRITMAHLKKIHPKLTDVCERLSIQMGYTGQ